MAFYEQWEEYVWEYGNKYYVSPSPLGSPSKEISYVEYASKKLNGAEDLYAGSHSMSTSASWFTTR